MGLTNYSIPGQPLPFFRERSSRHIRAASRFSRPDQMDRYMAPNSLLQFRYSNPTDLSPSDSIYGHQHGKLLEILALLNIKWLEASGISYNGWGMKAINDYHLTTIVQGTKIDLACRANGRRKPPGQSIPGCGRLTLAYEHNFTQGRKAAKRPSTPHAWRSA
jgi:hypothetical protein